MLQVYTGNGKGKTTAAIGLAIRAIGANKSVYIMQFMKSLAYSEQKILANLENITLETCGKPFFVAKKGKMGEIAKEKFGDEVVVFEENSPPKEYLDLVKNGLNCVNKALQSDYDIIILDEINVALFFNLISKGEVEEILDFAGEKEIICTGRNAPDWLVNRADLVTEMREIKHYYNNGIEARIGIEN